MPALSAKVSLTFGPLLFAAICLIASCDVSGDESPAGACGDETCGGACGDGVCDSGETCLSCETDCGVCPDCDVLETLGLIDGVEPESVSHHPPVRDSNGNLYRMLESTTSDGNHPRMMKSVDGGATWFEVDYRNRPRPSDLEGTYQLHVGSQIFFSMNTGDELYWVTFNMSDAASSADQWAGDELAEYGFTKTSTQYSSLTRFSDNTFLMFYSHVVYGEERASYVVRWGAGEFSWSQPLGPPGEEVVGPRVVKGAGDVGYVFYKDIARDELLMQMIGTDSVPGPVVRIDTNGTSSVAVPHIHPIVFQRDGHEVVRIAFAGTDDRLKLVDIVDGVPGAELNVTSGEVLQDAPVVTNEGTVATMALGTSSSFLIWTDDSSGDLLFRAIDLTGGVVGPEGTFWSAPGQVALYVYCTIESSPACEKLACTYDVGPHGDDAGDVHYRELDLSAIRVAESDLN